MHFSLGNIATSRKFSSEILEEVLLILNVFLRLLLKISTLSMLRLPLRIDVLLDVFKLCFNS